LCGAVLLPSPSMFTFKEKHFVLRDGFRYCQHRVGAGDQPCGQKFAKSTSVTVLKNHFIRDHKAEAQNLGLRNEKGAAASAAAAAADPASSQSQAESVVDMVLDNHSVAAAPASKPLARAASTVSSIASPPPAKSARTAQVTLQSAFMVSGNAKLPEAAALFFATSHDTLS
jgi:hypothetical protein